MAMLIDILHLGQHVVDTVVQNLEFGAGFIGLWFSSDPPPPTDTKVQNTNIPDYAEPYVTNMLEATQRQLFQMDKNGNVTGFNKYNPYSTNMNDYVAGLSPMQQQASQGVGGLQLPGQYGQASGLAGMSGIGAMGMAGQMANAGNNYNQMATNPYATQAFMNPYIQASLNPQLDEIRRQYGMNQTNQQSNATKQGAFGGSREALMASENNRNMNMGMNQAIGQGYNSAFQAAQQAQQFGANLGLQGQQGALAGYGQMNAAANTLGNLGQQQLQGQQNIYNQQNQFGQQQQQLEQTKINQAIQNYANEQQYPMMQLGMMSNMVRGLPLQGMTTQSYQAQPSTMQQLYGAAGAAGAGAGTTPPKAKGGILEAEPKRFDVGGSVKADIAKLPSDKLNDLMQSTPSQIVKGNIQAELALRNTGAAQNFKAGGILSFATGTPGKYEPSADQDFTDEYRQARSVITDRDLAKKYPNSADIPDYQGETPYDAALNYYKANRDNSDAAGTLSQRNEPVMRLENRRNAWIEGQKDPFTKEAPVGSKLNPQGIMLTEAQAAKPAVAKEEPKKVDVAKEEPKKVDKVNKKSILAADTEPTSDTPVAQMPTVKSISDEYLKSLTPAMKEIATDPEAAEKKVISTEDAIKNRQAMQDRFLDPALVAARKEDRANAMAQKASVPDELKRREQIREQNFWAKVGSTPGPIIATVLKGMIEKNATELADSEWGRKALGEANTLIAKLNDSDYLIAQGNIEKGMAEHEKAVDDVRKWFTLIEENKAKYLQTGATMADANLRAKTSADQIKSQERIARTNSANDRERNRLEEIKISNMPNKTETKELELAVKREANFDRAKKEGTIPQDMSFEDYVATHKLGANPGASKYDKWGKDVKTS
jgi:hypothetical protein